MAQTPKRLDKHNAQKNYLKTKICQKCGKCSPSKHGLFVKLAICWQRLVGTEAFQSVKEISRHTDITQWTRRQEERLEKEKVPTSQAVVSDMEKESSARKERVKAAASMLEKARAPSRLKKETSRRGNRGKAMPKPSPRHEGAQVSGLWRKARLEELPAEEVDRIDWK